MPFDFDASLFTTEQAIRASHLPLRSHKCTHNVCAACAVAWDGSKPSRRNGWQKCPLCLKLTSFNARVLPGGIDSTKCALLQLQHNVAADTTSISPAPAALSPMTGNNEEDSEHNDAAANSLVTAREERSNRRSALREAEARSTTSPDHGRDPDTRSAGSSPSADATDSSAAPNASPGMDGSFFFVSCAMPCFLWIQHLCLIFLCLLSLHGLVGTPAPGAPAPTATSNLTIETPTRELRWLHNNVVSDNGRHGLAVVVTSPGDYGITTTPSGVRSLRNPELSSPTLPLAAAEESDATSVPSTSIEDLVDHESAEENGGDGDARTASGGKDDDADGDAKKSFWVALFCCKIFRK